VSTQPISYVLIATAGLAALNTWKYHLQQYGPTFCDLRPNLHSEANMACRKQKTKIMEKVKIKKEHFQFKNYLVPIYEYNNDCTNTASEMTEPVFVQQVCRYQLVVPSKTT
jgi:hypothetical protein